MDPTHDTIPYNPTPMTEYEKEQAYYARQDARIRAQARRPFGLFNRLRAVTRRFTSSR